MKKEDIQLIIDLIQTKKKIKSSEISRLLSIPIRRIFDILPTLEVLRIITRTRGIVAWVEPTEVLSIETNNTYLCSELHISCIGVITSVKNLGNNVVLEQSGVGFSVEGIKV